MECLKGEEKATPRPRFSPRTRGTLRVFLSEENCAVVYSGRLLKMGNQEGLSGPPALYIAGWNDPEEMMRCPSASRQLHDEDRKPVGDWDVPLYQAYEHHPMNNRQYGEKLDHKRSF